MDTKTKQDLENSDSEMEKDDIWDDSSDDSMNSDDSEYFFRRVERDNRRYKFPKRLVNRNFTQDHSDTGAVRCGARQG